VEVASKVGPQLGRHIGRLDLYEVRHRAQLALGGERIDQLVHVIGVARRRGERVEQPRPGQRADAVDDELDDGLDTQRIKLDVGGALADRDIDQSIEGSVTGYRAKRYHHRHREVAEMPGQVSHAGHRRGICPLEVVDREDEKILDRRVFNQFGEPVNNHVLGGGLGDQACDLAPPWVAGTTTAKGVEQRAERSSLIELLTAADESPIGWHQLDDLGQQSRLADSGLADEEHQLATTGTRAVEALTEPVELRGSAEQAPRREP
jgi:hypothetical protein